jgi:hypothetical protein
VGAAIEFPRDEQAMPMDAGLLGEGVRDGDLHIVAAVDAQRGTKIVPVVAKRPALHQGKTGAAGLRLKRDRLPLPAGINQIGNLQLLRLGSRRAPHGRGSKGSATCQGGTSEESAAR